MNELREIKDMANSVLQAVRSVKTSNTEDPASMKSIVQELLLALGTFFEQIQSQLEILNQCCRKELAQSKGFEYNDKMVANFD